MRKKRKEIIMKITLSKRQWEFMSRKMGLMFGIDGSFDAAYVPIKHSVEEERLVRSSDCPTHVLSAVLGREGNDEISWLAAEHPNCTGKTLFKVLKRNKNDWVSLDAVRNPNCPAEALAMVMGRGKNDLVSYWAAENRNCPP